MNIPDAEMLMTTVIANSPIGVSLTRASDGKYAKVNAEWCTITGFAPEDAIGKTTIQLGIWPDAASRLAVLHPLQAHGRIRDLEVTMTAKGGHRVSVVMHGTAVDFMGEPHFLMFLTDVTAEREAQAALRASEAALKAMNDRLQGQLAIYDMTERLAGVGHWLGFKDGGVAGWSANMYNLVGMDPGTPLTSEVTRSFIVPEDLHLFVDARKRMDGQLIEHRYRRADGSVRWLRSRMSSHYKGDAHVVDFGVVQDFTDEREAREALQDKLDFIRKVTSRVPGMLYQFEMKADRTAAFTYVSDGVLQVFRVSVEEAKNNPEAIFALLHPDDYALVRQSVAQAARDHLPWEQEFRIKFSNGDVSWLSVRSTAERARDGGTLWHGHITDVSAQKEASAKLQGSEARFRALTDLSSDWYWEQDDQFRMVRVEGRLVQQDAINVANLLGKTRWEVGAANLNEQDWIKHRRVLESHQTFRDLELQTLDMRGNLFWMSVSGTPIFDGDGIFRGYRGMGRNITSSKDAANRIEQLAFFDALTGLPNRRLLVDRLQTAIALSERTRQSGALLFIDLDNFKNLNDTQGHEVGDLLLKQVGERLRNCVRESDTVARLGGDEFVVMIEALGQPDENGSTTELAQADHVGKKVLHSLNQPYRFGDLEHHSSPSIGVTLFLGHRETVDELLRRADLAMYQAKAEGRNTMRFFDPAMQVVVMARAALEADLRQSLSREELLLYYQPIVDKQTQVTGFEALVRWQHPERGLVLPGEFIALAEQTGLIVPIGKWVMHAALTQLVRWSGQVHSRALSISVNVSARQFRHPDFAEDVLEMIRTTGANPYRLKLELTESLLVADMQDAVAKMSELRAMGISFALDDFGTGYSSLSYLKRLPLDQLKIDQSFVADVLTDANDAAIARTVLALAQSLDLVAVAEGVENQGQRDFLANCGCKAFQGYFFGRPEPIAVVEAKYFKLHA